VGIALNNRFIFLVPEESLCLGKYLACKQDLVMATKSSPIEALDPLAGSELDIQSVRHITDPMSVIEALNAWDEMELT
jgi:hypothetical protein